ncbi:MAG: DegT/DnrJ/EryC1/StrS family aminotransferase [Candidatus Bathyarchaeia archaeon]
MAINKDGIPFFAPWINDADKEAVYNALQSRWLTGGPKAVEFEGLFANVIGSKYAISVNSCTAALHLAMRVLDIGPGDEVIVPVLTFAATANAPIFCGAKPVFADIDEKTYNISPKSIIDKISEKTKAIIVVHYGGQPCDMKEIMEIAKDHKLPVVEDCAHTVGATYLKRKAGTIGTIGCFSFYPTKILTTLEGGMFVTNNEDLFRRAKILREHGMTRSAVDRESGAAWYYDVIDLGYNYRLNEVQAVLGTSQLKRLSDINRLRVNAANQYSDRLKEIDGIITPFEAKDRTHSYHLYVIRVLEKKFGISRNKLFLELSEKKIGLSVHYTPLHLLTFYKNLVHHSIGDFPVAEQIYNEILSLPIFPTITEDQINQVVNEIKRAKERAQKT